MDLAASAGAGGLRRGACGSGWWGAGPLWLVGLVSHYAARVYLLLIAGRDGLDQVTLPAGLRTGNGLPGAIDVRLDSTKTQARLTTRLRGAREFLAST